MRATKFSIDTYGNRVFEGYSDDQEWNGWACPLFSYEEAQRIAAVCNEHGGRASYDEQHDRFIFHLNESDLDEPEIYSSEQLEGKKLYAIGAFNWIWEELDDAVAENAETYEASSND